MKSPGYHAHRSDILIGHVFIAAVHAAAAAPTSASTPRWKCLWRVDATPFTSAIWAAVQPHQFNEDSRTAGSCLEATPKPPPPERSTRSDLKFVGASHETIHQANDSCVGYAVVTHLAHLRMCLAHSLPLQTQADRRCRWGRPDSQFSHVFG
eukprot:GHVT01097135.1.p2 GENE.GHVT01097135.1~~GHVT01097135.1.p2  ORF type:complete len:152 (+),score=15.16 GHVT01097135.1:929-1384(+)